MRDQADAAFRPPEALGVEFGILADNKTFRNDDTVVDHHILELRAASNLHIRQDDRPFKLGEGIGPDTGKEQALVEAGAGDDAVARDDGRRAEPRRSSSS